MSRDSKTRTFGEPTTPRPAPPPIPRTRPEFQQIVDALRGFDIGFHDGAADFVADLLAHLEPHGLTVR